jgi:hypothetical protein
VTISSQIQALKDLAALDSVLREVGEELSREREALEAKKAQLAELNARVEAGTASIREMEQTRGDLMGELRQMSLQVSKSREKLSRCRTEREANAAQREVEELRKLYRDREIDIEKLSTLVETARAETAETETQRDTLAAELGNSEGAVQGKLAELETTSSAEGAKRKKLVAEVDSAIFRRYDLIRKRKGLAISPTVDGGCKVCHMSLPPMLVQQVQQGRELIQCPSCQRILYFDPSEQSSDEASAEEQSG